MQFIWMMALFCFIPFGSLESQNIFGGGKPYFQRETTALPFELRGHKIYIKVFINRSGKPYNFILDTGAFTSVDSRTMQETGLSRGKALDAGGEIRYAYLAQEKINLHLGDVGVDDFQVSCMDYSYFYKSDPEMQGFLGSDFLHFFYVKIDYQQRIVTLSRYPFKIPSFSPVYQMTMNSRNQASLPKIECQIDRRWRWSGLIDTGSPFAMVFPISSLQKHRESRSPIVESLGTVARWPTSRIEKNYLSRLDQLVLGDLTLENIPVLFANTEDIILGEEFLSQFILYLHYPDDEVILQPLGKPGFRQNFYSAGVTLGKTDDQRTVIEAIWKGSAADQAGLTLNSEVTRINGEPARDLSQGEITRLLNNDRISTIELRVRNGFRENTYQLKKAPLLP